MNKSVKIVPNSSGYKPVINTKTPISAKKSITRLPVKRQEVNLSPAKSMADLSNKP
jgi:hypothetical protein